VSQLRIVVAYPDGALSSGLFRAVQRARRAIERGGYSARIDLVPRSTAQGDVVVDADAPLDELNGLIERLVAEGRLVRGPQSPRAVAIHRGLVPVGDRARIAE
jgi:hypothetical protein